MRPGAGPDDQDRVLDTAGGGTTGWRSSHIQNHADNNGWKRRHELTAGHQRTGQDLAAKIRPKLDGLRAAGDFAPASTRQALLDVGIGADAIEVTTRRPPAGKPTPPPGTVYAVHFGQAGGVIGDVRAERVLVD
jgi:hypothetical protein